MIHAAMRSCEWAPDGIELRPLTGGDAQTYAELLIAIWRETYNGLMPAERLSSLELGAVTNQARRMLDDPNGPSTLGAFRGDALVGWARAGEPRDDGAPLDLELHSPNVAREARGTGVARHLMENALGGRSAYLWVVEGNERARSFYHRSGFRDDGERRWEETDQTHEVRMVRLADATVLSGTVRPPCADGEGRPWYSK